jgi:two-component system, LytTR family, sensor kinase
VEVEVDADVLDAEVPNLILQPLVENAIRHGIGRRRDAGRIALVARRQGESLDLRVRDNGPGLPGGGEVALGTGVGLANTQARLEQLYGSAHRFELRNRPEGGLEVVLMIPFRLHRPEGPRTVPAEHAAEPAPAASTGAAVVATSR